MERELLLKVVDKLARHAISEEEVMSEAFHSALHAIIFCTEVKNRPRRCHQLLAETSLLSWIQHNYYIGLGTRHESHVALASMTGHNIVP